MNFFNTTLPPAATIGADQVRSLQDSVLMSDAADRGQIEVQASELLPSTIAGVATVDSYFDDQVYLNILVSPC